MTFFGGLGRVIGYFQAGGVTDNPVARLLDDGILSTFPEASVPPVPGNDAS